MKKLKIILLHLLPIAGNIEHNKNLIENSILKASEYKPDWIITPELALSGLQFSKKIGVNWIEEQPDSWLKKISEKIKLLKTNLFVGLPEKDHNGNYYNSVFVINNEGKIIGKQRKITSFIDEWSTSGEKIEPIEVSGINVGIVICADSYSKNIADTLKNKGAEFLIAPSAWGPGQYGPEGEWEQRTIDTGLPMFVCNRTGEDETVSFWQADSSVIKDGKRLISHNSIEPFMIIIEWNLDKKEIDSYEIKTL